MNSRSVVQGHEWVPTAQDWEIPLSSRGSLHVIRPCVDMHVELKFGLLLWLLACAFYPCTTWYFKAWKSSITMEHRCLSSQRYCPPRPAKRDENNAVRHGASACLNRTHPTGMASFVRRIGSTILAAYHPTVAYAVHARIRQYSCCFAM